MSSSSYIVWSEWCTVKCVLWNRFGLLKTHVWTCPVFLGCHLKSNFCRSTKKKEEWIKHFSCTLFRRYFLLSHLIRIKVRPTLSLAPAIVVTTYHWVQEGVKFIHCTQYIFLLIEIDSCLRRTQKVTMKLMCIYETFGLQNGTGSEVSMKINVLSMHWIDPMTHELVFSAPLKCTQTFCLDQTHFKS